MAKKTGDQNVQQATQTQAQPQAHSQADMVRQAIAELGNDASFDDVKNYCKQKFNQEPSQGSFYQTRRSMGIASSDGRGRKAGGTNKATGINAENAVQVFESARLLIRTFGSAEEAKKLLDSMEESD